VNSALASGLVGQKMERVFSITRNQLELSLVDKSEGWRVTYERY